MSSHILQLALTRRPGHPQIGISLHPTVQFHYIRGMEDSEKVGVPVFCPPYPPGHHRASVPAASCCFETRAASTRMTATVSRYTIATASGKVV